MKNPCVTTIQSSFLLSNSRIVFLHLSTVSTLLSFCLLPLKYHCKRPIIFQIHNSILIEQSTNDFKGTSSASIPQYTLSGNKPRAVSLVPSLILSISHIIKQYNIQIGIFPIQFSKILREPYFKANSYANLYPVYFIYSISSPGAKLSSSHP